MSEQVKIEIEYCGGWGYGPRFRELSKAIKASIPEAHVSGFVGRRTSFEVKFNGEEVYSKLETSEFPDNEEMVQIITKLFKGPTPPPSPTPVQKVEKTFKCCGIL